MRTKIFSFTVLALLLLSGLAGVLTMPGMVGTASAWDPPSGTSVWNAASDGVFSSADNWLPLGVPAAGTNLVFNSTSVRNCSWDLAVTVGNIYVDASYTGRITQGNVEIGYHDLYMNHSLSWYGSNYWQKCSGDFYVKTSNSLPSNNLKLEMTGDDHKVYGYSERFKELKISADVVFDPSASYSYLGTGMTVSPGASLNITKNILRWESWYTGAYFDNYGSIVGAGTLNLYLYTYDRSARLGNISCYLTVQGHTSASANRTLTMVGPATLSDVVVSSNHASYTMTLTTGNYDASIVSLTLGDRGYLKAGSSDVTINDWMYDPQGHFIADTSNLIFDSTATRLNSLKYLTTFPDDGNAASGNVHPSIEYFEEAWNGYHYWMVYTPYPAAAQENPSIAASNDKLNWYAPAGLTNPLDGPPVTGWYADPWMVYDSAHDELRIYWYWFGAEGQIYTMNSSDGITWSGPTEITMAGDSGTRSTPQVIELPNGTFVMISMDQTNTQICKRYSSDGITFGAPIIGTTTGSLPTGLSFFHGDFAYNADRDAYVGLVHLRNLTSSIYTEPCVFVYSIDGGENWVIQGVVLSPYGWDSTALYRPGIWFDGSYDCLNIIYTGNANYKYYFGYTAAPLEYTSTSIILHTERLGYVLSTSALNNVIFLDDTMVLSDLSFSNLGKASGVSLYTSYHTLSGTGADPTILSDPDITVNEDSAYSYLAIANQDIQTWSFQSNATWLSFDGHGGISGIPDNTAVGSYYIKISGTNYNGTVWQNYTVTVTNVVPSWTTDPVTHYYNGEAYSYDANTSQEGKGVTYAMSDSSGDLSIDSATGEITGTITGIEAVTVEISAADGHSFTFQQFTIYCALFFVSPAPTEIDQGLRYQYEIEVEALNGPVTYTYDLDGLDLIASPTNGRILGTVDVVGNYSITVTATDALGHAVTQSYTLMVMPVGEMPEPSIIIIVIVLVFLALMLFLGIKYPKFLVLPGFSFVAAAVLYVQPLDSTFAILMAGAGIMIALWGVFHFYK